jgi:hypothetical protein
MSEILTCPDCGKAYECRPGQGCWCEALPPVIAVPAPGTRCLCPCQLDRLIAAQRAATDRDARP